MFEITEMLIAVLKNQFLVLFIIIFGTLSFPVVALDILKRFRSDRRGQNVKQVGL